jgi:hypothetical protein
MVSHCLAPYARRADIVGSVPQWMQNSDDELAEVVADHLVSVWYRMRENSGLEAGEQLSFLSCEATQPGRMLCS